MRYLILEDVNELLYFINALATKIDMLHNYASWGDLSKGNDHDQFVLGENGKKCRKCFAGCQLIISSMHMWQKWT